LIRNKKERTVGPAENQRGEEKRRPSDRGIEITPGFCNKRPAVDARSVEKEKQFSDIRDRSHNTAPGPDSGPGKKVRRARALLCPVQEGRRKNVDRDRGEQSSGRKGA